MDAAVKWSEGTGDPGRHVAEVPGDYGPVAVPELLIQKIWLRGDFRAESLETIDGRAVKVLHPGRWNRLGGPDFLGAELEIGGVRRIGDIELHFYRGDWEAHGHDVNPAFQGVILHVVVFDPRGRGRPVATASGARPAECVLAPLLPLDLEAYAHQDALRQLEERDLLELAAPLLELPVEDRRALLREEAVARWREKVARLRVRVADADWAPTAHAEVLMALGFARNRPAMHAVAQRYPLEVWRDRPMATAEAAWRDPGIAWRLGAMRPANHPKTRLRQYAQWMAARPDWVRSLGEASWPLEDPRLDEQTGAFRRRGRLKQLTERWARDLAADAVGGSRWQTLCVDVFLPLLAAAEIPGPWQELWYHWFPGDLPDRAGDFLRVAGLHRDARAWPMANGSFQGVLRWLASR